MSPSDWSGKGWTITITDTEITIAHESGSVSIRASDTSRLELRRKWLKWNLLDNGRQVVYLRGLKKHEASTLARALHLLTLMPTIAGAIAWHTIAGRLLSEARAAQRWISAEAVDALLATRPERRVLARIRTVGCEESLTEDQLEAVGFLDTDLESLVADTNEEIVTAELIDQRVFFDTIEKSPLTEEQARAVVCFDNRVQVLAAAGSGKTSLMIARAAYAVSRGFTTPDRILLLAFNKAAATELEDRVLRASRPLGSTRQGCEPARSIHSASTLSARPPAKNPGWHDGLTRGTTSGLSWRSLTSCGMAQSHSGIAGISTECCSQPPQQTSPRTNRTAMTVQPPGLATGHSPGSSSRATAND